jgi:hypothetical protein
VVAAIGPPAARAQQVLLIKAMEPTAPTGGSAIPEVSARERSPPCPKHAGFACALLGSPAIAFPATYKVIGNLLGGFRAGRPAPESCAGCETSPNSTCGAGASRRNRHSWLRRLSPAYGGTNTPITPRPRAGFLSPLELMALLRARVEHADIGEPRQGSSLQPTRCSREGAVPFPRVGTCWHAQGGLSVPGERGR